MRFFFPTSISRLFALSLIAAAPQIFAQQDAPVAYVADGSVAVVKDGVQTDGSESLNTPLEPGTIVTTGEDGSVSIQIAPGIAIRLQPGTQISLFDGL